MLGWAPLCTMKLKFVRLLFAVTLNLMKKGLLMTFNAKGLSICFLLCDTVIRIFILFFTLIKTLDT